MEPAFSYVKIKKEEKEKAENKVERKKNVQKREMTAETQQKLQNLKYGFLIAIVLILH